MAIKSEYQQAYDASLAAKKIADKQLAIAKLKMDLDNALCKSKLLSPAKRREVVDNINIGYLIHGPILMQDWSAHADGTQIETECLREIGNKFIDRATKLEN